MADGRRFVVGPAAGVTRRELSPMAWTVLEEMLAASRGSAERCVAELSARSLAAEVGVSKDTIARAIGRLRWAGVVVASQGRASAGTFAPGCYRIVVPDGIDLDPADTNKDAIDLMPNRQQATHRERRELLEHGSQLALWTDG